MRCAADDENPMVLLLNQKSFRPVQNLPFCYLCGRSFSASDSKNRDHVPPECLFAPEDREPLLLPTHVDCNKAYELIDEKMGQLIALRYGKVPSPEYRRLKFTLSPSDVKRRDSWRGHECKYCRRRLALDRGISLGALQGAGDWHHRLRHHAISRRKDCQRSNRC